MAKGCQRGRFFGDQVALMLWACAACRCSSEELLEAVQRDVVARHEQFSANHLASVLHAFAMLGHGSRAILEAAAEKIIERVADYAPQASRLKMTRR